MKSLRQFKLTVVALVLASAVASDARSAPRAAVTPDVVGNSSTSFAAGQPRVINIRRAAQLLDGTVIPAGARFSMNDALGERTRAKGFVSAPMIAGGMLVDSGGGGISQIATTLYNAAFFAGLRLVAHTPHSFYISRYPMGREATISWGGPELVFDNDWPAPLRMRFTVRADTVAVRFCSSRLGRRVESWTGRPYAFRQPTTRVVHDPGHVPGTHRVVQEAGPAGFTIEYGRLVYQRGRVIRNERWRVVYQPEDRVIEIGTR